MSIRERLERLEQLTAQRQNPTGPWDSIRERRMLVEIDGSIPTMDEQAEASRWVYLEALEAAIDAGDLARATELAGLDPLTFGQ